MVNKLRNMTLFIVYSHLYYSLHFLGGGAQFTKRYSTLFHHLSSLEIYIFDCYRRKYIRPSDIQILLGE